MYTQRENVKHLCKSIITRLENEKSISFPPRLRQIVQDELYGMIGPYIMTDEDVRAKALEKMGARAEMLSDTAFTEGEQFKAAKAIVRKSFGDDTLNGFFFIKPLKTVALMVGEFLMRSSHIDDVYESDEDIQKQVVEIVQKFKPENAH